MPNRVYDNGEKKHKNRNAIDAVHHPQVYAGRAARIGLTEHVDKVPKHRTNAKIINQFVHGKWGQYIWKPVVGFLINNKKTANTGP